MFSLRERYGCRFHLEWVYSFCPSGIEVRRVVCQKELCLRLKGLVVSTAAKFHDFFVYSSSRRLRSNGCGFLGPHRLKSLRFFLGSLERWCFFGELPVPMLPLGHQGTWLTVSDTSDSVFDLTASKWSLKNWSVPGPLLHELCPRTFSWALGCPSFGLNYLMRFAPR